MRHACIDEYCKLNNNYKSGEIKAPTVVFSKNYELIKCNTNMKYENTKNEKYINTKIQKNYSMKLRNNEKRTKIAKTK